MLSVRKIWWDKTHTYTLVLGGLKRGVLPELRFIFQLKARIPASPNGSRNNAVRVAMHFRTATGGVIGALAPHASRLMSQYTAACSAEGAKQKAESLT
jgi:hypothetical protein